ncbi:uncharacterized protein SEPMUDRAFT_146038 [Sphaerulina musiva SO2202]|uniref:Secreted protein n=1 Tax=Sphaerulina musiva (strain SO2202) TaxID=692275 RepID=N1QM23_SPHMS|nr:uncharacterized protein SEPMUDRAFT_146038 [Sphaerulina musiva SO2202]EMF16908.1 hypothetical protein SEPMUDRAFT_76587 [Sphaerulina musiva SO2202]
MSLILILILDLAQNVAVHRQLLLVFDVPLLSIHVQYPHPRSLYCIWLSVENIQLQRSTLPIVILHHIYPDQRIAHWKGDNSTYVILFADLSK